jgi:hypothetical protein
MNVWYFEGTEDAYNSSQSCDLIKDGDVLCTPLTIGFLMGAWPVAVIGEPGEFHLLAEGKDWDTVDGGKYLPSVALCRVTAFATPEDVEKTEATIDAFYADLYKK